MRESVQKLKNKLSKLKNQKGFTLIELMAVLAILALIVMIAVPAIGNILDKAADQAVDSNRELVENAAELAFISGDYTGAYTAQGLADGGYLKADAETIENFDNGSGKADSDDEFGYTLAKSTTSNSGVFEATPKTE